MISLFTKLFLAEWKSIPYSLFPDHYGKTTSLPCNQPQYPERNMVTPWLISYLLGSHPFLHSSSSSFQLPEFHLLLTYLWGNFATAPFDSTLTLLMATPPCTSIVSHPKEDNEVFSFHTGEVKTREKEKIILLSATHPDTLQFISFTGY